MEDREILIETLEDVAATVGGEFRHRYSGRGMFGKNCVAIDCDHPARIIEESVSRGVRGARADNMGKGYIVYWPDIESKES